MDVLEARIMHCKGCGATLYGSQQDYCSTCSSLRERGAETRKEREARPTARPWVRFFARQTDYQLLNLAFIPLALWIAGRPPSDRNFQIVLAVVLPVLSTGVWMIIEALLISKLGTTPGKWLLRVTVGPGPADPLSLSMSFKRSFLVWYRGVALGVPVANLLAFLHAHGVVIEKGKTTWDDGLGIEVHHGPISTSRAVVAAAVLLAWPIAIRFFS